MDTNSLNMSFEVLSKIQQFSHLTNEGTSISIEEHLNYLMLTSQKNGNKYCVIHFTDFWSTDEDFLRELTEFEYVIISAPTTNRSEAGVKISELHLRMKAINNRLEFQDLRGNLWRVNKLEDEFKEQVILMSQPSKYTFTPDYLIDFDLPVTPVNKAHEIPYLNIEPIRRKHSAFCRADRIALPPKISRALVRLYMVHHKHLSRFWLRIPFRFRKAILQRILSHSA